MKKFVLAVSAAIVFAALTTPVARAGDWFVQDSSPEPPDSQIVTTNTYVISRSTSCTNASAIVHYRTVGLTAFPGKHFVSVSGRLAFAPGEISKTVAVEEILAFGSSFLFQINELGSSRRYLFEVLDEGGSLLASTTRTLKAVANPVSWRDLFRTEKCVDLFDADTNNWPRIYVSDDGFDQFNWADEDYRNRYAEWYAEMNVTGDQFDLQDLPMSYLRSIDACFHMTFDFDARECDDGYQHVQVIVNKDDNTFDDNAKDSDPGTPHHSSYLACFSHADDYTNWNFSPYSFPVTTVDNNEGAKDPWTGHHSDLMKQRFNTDCRASDGSLALPLDLEVIRFRFDASGYEEDGWELGNNFNVHIWVADDTAPTLDSSSYTDSIVVSPGPHIRGSTARISIAFSEIVLVSDAVKLETSWGDFVYETGAGSNVLTFRGTIDANVGTILLVKVKAPLDITDLAENSFVNFHIGGYVIHQYVEEPSAGYTPWASAFDLGAWNATDACGVHNIFRYAFDKPVGAFTKPSLISISLEGGQPVVHTPPLVKTEGYTFSILATDTLDGAGASTAYALDPSGRTPIPASDNPARFFRLRVEER